MEESKTGSTESIATMPAWLSARRKFNTHFLTLWHLTFLSSSNSGPGSHIRAAFNAVMKGGNILRQELTSQEFDIFDIWFNQRLYFIGIEFSKITMAKQCAINERTGHFHTSMVQREVAEAQFDEVCLVMIANYDKCLELAKTLDDQIVTNRASLVQVCFEVVKHCCDNISDFKRKNSLAWISQFIFRVHQLLILAKNCYSNDNPVQLGKLDQLFSELSKFTADLQKHFVEVKDSKDSEASNEDKMFQPIVPLNSLISTLKENAKCAAEQIPTAVTSIIHEYNHLDPFNLHDAKSIQMKVTMSMNSSELSSNK